MSDRWRRPTPKRCSDVAVWLIRVGAREPFRADSVLDAETSAKLIEAAGIVDAYGLALAARRANQLGIDA